MRSLVGYTGFVGSNLNLNGEFEGLYNSKNIGEAFGTCPDILVYSGVPRQKFIANKYPERDFEIVKNAFENIKKINKVRAGNIKTSDDTINSPFHMLKEKIKSQTNFPK